MGCLGFIKIYAFFGKGYSQVGFFEHTLSSIASPREVVNLQGSRLTNICLK